MALAAPVRRHRGHPAPKPPPTEWDRLVEHRLAFESTQQGLRLAKTAVSTVARPYYLYSVRTNRLLAVSEGGMTLDEVARYLFR